MATIIQRSFSGGEIAPALYSRIDLTKYKTGLRTLRNFFVMRHGGAANRPGTRFIGRTKNPLDKVTLIDFIFSVNDTFMLEVGDQYIRVIKNQKYITTNPLTISSISQANPAIFNFGGLHNLSVGDEITLTGLIFGPDELNGKNLRVASTPFGNTATFNYLDGTPVDTTAMPAYASGGSAEQIYEIVTPYLSSEVCDLDYIQSADVMTIVHPNHAPAELKRLDDDNWTLTDLVFTPSISNPSTVNTAGGVPPGSGGSGTVTAFAGGDSYKVTAISANGEESTGLQATHVWVATVDDPITISWPAVAGAVEYNIYKRTSLGFGLIAVTGSLSVKDIGSTPDINSQPPIFRNPFDNNNHPATVNYLQQRLTFGNTVNNSEVIEASRSAAFKNFTVSDPGQDDDAITFNMAGRTINEVRHILELGKPIIFTSTGEWTLEGNESGVLTPAGINPRQHSYNGSASNMEPIVIDSTALYVQARNTTIRDLGFDHQVDGYRGDDLTIFSAHLFDDYKLQDWAYQKIPHSVLWVVREDGVLLSLTYVREQNITAWARHDFQDAKVEAVSVIPEGPEDAVYLVLKREVDGAEVRYVERFTRRNIINEVDNVFMDSSLSYDGRNYDENSTMTISGGTDWDYTEDLILTSDLYTFTTQDEGNEIQITVDGLTLKLRVVLYNSANEVIVNANKTVPVNFRNTALSTWSRAVDELAGLDHLEGQKLSIVGDRHVVGSPFNDSYTEFSVSGGSVTLDKPYSVIHAGLPFISDIETLNIDSAQGETLIDKNKLSNHVTLSVEETRGLFAGTRPPEDDSVDPLQNLSEYKSRNCEDYDDPTKLKTDTIEVNINSDWENNGRVFVRQIDPLPTTILAIAPSGFMPFRK